MTAPLPPGLGAGFDSELGLQYLEVTPDGGRARLEITDKVKQPWGIVHGGVYCSIVESLASGEERVRILLEFLGRTSVVEVPAAKLLSERGPREALSPK